MQVSAVDKKTLEETHDKLNRFLDSADYQEIIGREDLEREEKIVLLQLPRARNQLALSLFKVYAAEIRERDGEFANLLREMRAVRAGAEAAVDHLKKIADRIESAVTLAKGVDAAIKLAAKFA